MKNNKKRIKNKKNESSLDKIRSVYILLKVFDLCKIKFLNCIKYNKKIQHRINKNINDYKEEYKKNILIEIIPQENEYGKFIQIQNNNFSHLHFYINDNDETKRNYINVNDNIKKLKIIIEPDFNNFESLFENCSVIRKIHFIKFKKKI